MRYMNKALHTLISITSLKTHLIQGKLSLTPHEKNPKVYKEIKRIHKFYSMAICHA